MEKTAEDKMKRGRRYRDGEMLSIGREQRRERDDNVWRTENILRVAGNKGDEREAEKRMKMVAVIGD